MNMNKVDDTNEDDAISIGFEGENMVAELDVVVDVMVDMVIELLDVVGVSDLMMALDSA